VLAWVVSPGTHAKRRQSPVVSLSPSPLKHADTAFRSLYAEHGPALLRLATALTRGDCGRAEDLVQETMLRAWTLPSAP
jgi:RNA polymerase sigma-70 factor (ECF subfamily)